jgi:hypothetical protein
MEEQLVSYNVAKLAKEKGFDEYGPEFYDCGEQHSHLGDYFKNSILNDENFVVAPTQSLLQKWLRETHNINLWCYIPNLTGYWANNLENKAKYNTYEEALEKGLLETLYLI